MNNEIVNNGRTHTNEVMLYNPGASAVEMRMDSVKYPRIFRLAKADAIAGLSQVIANAYLYRGQSADTATIQLMSSTLYDEIMKDEYGHRLMKLSIAEIGAAVKRAVLGQGKEMFGISIATLYAAICDYATTTARAAQEQADKAFKEARKKALQQSEVGALIDEMAKQLISK